MQLKQQQPPRIVNNKLSLSRNLTNSAQSIKLNITPQTRQINNNLQKMTLKIYLTDDGRMFIDKAAAYSLGYIDTRPLFIDNIKKIEISERQLAGLKARENITLEYEKLVSNKDIAEKPKIEVFIDNIDYYITPSAAYSLGLISVENFNSISNELYHVSDNLLEFLKNKYNITYKEIEKGRTK